MTEDDRIDKAARAICAEKCAFMGEPPCWQIGDGLSPDCDEPGCLALAEAAVAAARLTAALEKIPIAIREAGLTSPYSKGRTPAFQYGLSDGYEAAAQVADECVRAALQKETDR